MAKDTRSTPKPESKAGGKKELVLPTGKLALTKDPRVWGMKLPSKIGDYRRVLGLDLASSCGASFCDILPGQPVTAAPIIGGQWNLSVGPHDTNSLRYIRLQQFLAITQPDLIFYEEVKFVGQSPPPGMKQNLTALVARAVSGAQVVHGLAAILVTWAERHNVPCQAIGIGQLKKYATDKGNANKVEMITACNEQFGTEFEAETYEASGVDNIADSMFLCAMAVQNYSEGLT